MRLVPLGELTDAHWFEAWRTVYDPALAMEVGTNPQLIMTPPTLVEFYRNLTGAMEAGNFMGWGIIDGDRYLGHAVMDRTGGEWELGVVIPEQDDRHRGTGVRAALHALRWAFEDQGAEWVVAFVNHPHTDYVRDILTRGGFRKLMHFFVMDSATWDERWRKEDTDG